MNIGDEIILQHIQELRQIISSANGKLVKSRISPDDYFTNLSYDVPKLKFPEVGISRCVVNTCELISTLLLEDTDEAKPVSKIIVMIFEYYFLVGPILFKSQGARFVNDVTFMKHFMKYVKSLFASRTLAQKEIENTLVSLEIYNPIKDIESI